MSVTDNAASFRVWCRACEPELQASAPSLNKSQATPGLADIANQAKALVFRSESCVQADQIISLFDQLLAFNTALELIIERFGELERWAITTR
ncbi:hypothetical protein AB1N83_012546 [Pleurotus pulmonarius]